MTAARGTRPVPEGATISTWSFIRPHFTRLLLGLGLVAVNRATGLVLPASTKYLIDDVLGRRNTTLLGPILLCVGVATVLQALTTLAMTSVLTQTAQRTIALLRCRVQEHISMLPLRVFDDNRTGTLVSRVMNDVESLRTLIGSGLVQFAGNILTAAIACVVLIHLNARMTICAVSLIIAFGVFARYAFGSLKKLFHERAQLQGEVVGRLTESFAGIRVVKGYHKESMEAKIFRSGAFKLLRQIYKATSIQAYMNLSSALSIGSVGLLVTFMGTNAVLRGQMSLGSFLTYTLFLNLTVSPILQLADTGSQFAEATAGLARTREILSLAPETADPKRTISAPELSGKVQFENVSFSYLSGRMVLHDVSFRAAQGTVTALVGPSGAGKSTIIGLLAAFYSPCKGRVDIDGYDLSQLVLKSYREQIAVVLQETFLFDGSLVENVAFSRPRATMEDILVACKAAHVDEFAQRLVDGYHTVIGERGVKLSGGQKQRVAIARAILVDPKILILDEATSSLDSESEALIQDALGRLVQGRTTFVIAHRLSTIRGADQILVIEDGRIVERGVHDTLIDQRGRYYDLYTKQHGVLA